MATVAATTLGPEPESLVLVDMSKLTQSELQTLSLRSSSLQRRLASSDHLFLPKIDRSIFNESAGSRRQTYYSPDTALSSSSTSAAGGAGHHHRNRVAGLLPVPKLPALPLDDDPERRENIAIIRSLKHYISQNPSPSFNHIDLIPPSLPAPVGISSDGFVSFSGERKRKRGRKPKVETNLNVEHRIEIKRMGTLEMKNKNGVAVDVDALAGIEDPYGEELRKRTEGLQSEEELLAFLRDLGGEWGSRRKRRKIVDAGILGDFLPIGWKLLLGLRRREGHASVFCRRYLSPSGQQFLSCKAISSYFKSYLGLQATSQSMNQGTDDIQLDCRLDNVHQHTGESVKDNIPSLGIISRPTAPTHYSQNALDKEVKVGPEKVAEIQVNGIFECHKCNTTFNEKDSYLQHLVSFHQRTMRRYRIGSSVGDGVIMKDGKYECQFCHKVFEERRRYNGHVGIHVRDYMRRKEESSGQGSDLNKMESSSGKRLPSRISKMDALIEIAKNSILETSTTGDHHESTAGFASKANLDNDTKVDSPISDMVLEKTDSERTLDEDFTDSEDECEITNEKGRLQVDSEHAPEVSGNVECEKRVAKSMDEQNNNSIYLCSGEDCQTGTFNDISKIETADKDEFAITNVKGNLQEDSELAPYVKVELECETKVAESMDWQTNNNTTEMCSWEDCQTVTSLINNAKTEAADKKEYESSHVPLNGNLASIGPTGNPNSDEKMLEITDGSAGHTESGTDIMQTIQQNHDRNIQQCSISIPDTFSKGEDDLCSIEQEEENLAPFEELRYEEVEPLEFRFVAIQEESHPMPEEPIDMTPIAAMDGQFSHDLSLPFGPEELTLDLTTTKHQRTSACVWCGLEFSHEDTDSDVQPDSVGFMCPACKVKLSGQLNAFGNGSPADPNSM